MTATDLIARSIIHTEIVTADWTDALAVDLLAECEDNVDTMAGRIEYWGTDEDGCEWRVHLNGAPTD